MGDQGEPFDDNMIVLEADTMIDTANMSIAELQEACVDEAALLDLNDHGDGDDSDEEGVESLLHSCAVNVKMYLSSGEMVGDDIDKIDEEGEVSSDVNTWIEPSTSLKGAPPGWNPPGPTDKWTSYTVNDKKHNAPEEEDIDNPGDWHLFAFRPKYESKEKGRPKYIDHFSPAGAKIVKQNQYDQRVVDGWDVHYDGWVGDAFDQSTYVRGDAEQGNLKPTSRKGSLDADVLIKHGFNADRVAHDPFFLFQMLFPIIIPKESTISDDHRMPFFSQMTWFTHIYAAEKGAGMGFGHKWVMPDVAEMIRWTAIPIRNGALDGNPGTLPHRWKPSDPRYDRVIAESMPYTRFLQLKRYMKLNNNSTEPKRGTANYDPCCKYDMIFKVLVHNMNYATKYADLDPSMDESTWGFGGFSGDAGWRLMNKPFDKGERGTQLDGMTLFLL